VGSSSSSHTIRLQVEEKERGSMEPLASSI